MWRVFTSITRTSGISACCVFAYWSYRIPAAPTKAIVNVIGSPYAGPTRIRKDSCDGPVGMEKLLLRCGFLNSIYDQISTWNILLRSQLCTIFECPHDWTWIYYYRPIAEDVFGTTVRLRGERKLNGRFMRQFTILFPMVSNVLHTNMHNAQMQGDESIIVIKDHNNR